MSDLPIRPYERLPSAFHAWDPRTVDVAREVSRLVASASPGTVVEHIGSSAARLPGKNVVDLACEADPDAIPAVVDALRSLGFGEQGGMAPFPPTRPMLTGIVVHDDSPFRVHLHVVPPARDELREMTAFRDALLADPALHEAYAATKRRIVAEAPVGDANLLYTARKSGFVEDALYRLGIRRGPADPPEPLSPGAVIGVMGGGQLGRMLGFSARAMGYRLVALDPDPACPTAAVADEIVVGRYDDAAAARRLGAMSDVVTYELEHVGVDAAAAAGALAPLRPGLTALRATQDRLAERRFLRDIGEGAAPWREVRGPADAEAAAETLGYPVRLKIPLGGYDGRSQVRVTSRGEVAGAVAALGGSDGRPLLLEKEIDFEAELSVVCARGRDGRTLAYPVSRNVHDAGILTESVAPAPIHPVVANDAREIADSIARGLDVVGVLTVELFLLRGGGLMVNELAPRVHNCGHWSRSRRRRRPSSSSTCARSGPARWGPWRRTAVDGHGQPAGHGSWRDARLTGMDGALADPGVHVHVYGKRGCSSGARWAT